MTRAHFVGLDIRPRNLTMTKGTIVSDDALIRLQRTAFHEAGHAVMAKDQEVEISEISVIPNGTRLGRVLLAEGARIHWRSVEAGLCDRLQLEPVLLTALAGPIAEEVFLGRKPEDSSDNDYEVVTGIVQNMWSEPETGLAHIQFLSCVVREFLRFQPNWEAVRALAEALVERDRLAAEEAFEIIDKAGAAAKADLPTREGVCETVSD